MSLRPVLHAGRSLTRQNLPRPARRCARKYATPASSTVPEEKPCKYGQPLFPSHPHLMRPDEITPGITAEEYERRRKALMDSLPDKSLVVCVAGQIKYMSGQIFYKFRQASDFWYLTGFAEPASALLLQKAPSTARGYRMTLFSGGTDPAKALWDGARMSHADAELMLGADDAQPTDALPAALRRLLPAAERIYIDVPPKRGRSAPRSLLKFLASDVRDDHDALSDAFGSEKRKPLVPEVRRLRAVKSEAEQRVMHAAADISARAHAKTMRFVEPDMSEHLVATHFEYLCAREGSERPAYVPVVASGANALAIHYTANNQLVRDGELILMDAGCEYHGYASDITRTFPVSGKFTSPQAELYGAVLTAQRALIKLCSAAAGYSLAQLHRTSCDLLRVEIARIGLPGGSRALAELYPHYIGHPVGIDLHESSHVDRNEPLKAGMVVTVEPGIYVPPSPAYPKHFHNIGIRIEDEVLVGESDPIVLSVNAPKEIVDVEGACQGLLGLEPL